MFSEYPLPLDAPVYVTHEQATAYAQWRGMRLPSEAEYPPRGLRRAALQQSEFPLLGPDPGDRRRRRHDAADATGRQRLGVDVHAVCALPRLHSRSRSTSNYSEPFFDGQHYVLKGASPRTAECFLRPSFRNWFRPSYPYVYATFRMVNA